MAIRHTMTAPARPPIEVEHTTVIRAKDDDSGRTIYWVTCSCGWEDPKRSTDYLVNRFDAEASEHDHHCFPPTRVVNGRTLYRSLDGRGKPVYVSIPED